MVSINQKFKLPNNNNNNNNNNINSMNHQLPIQQQIHQQLQQHQHQLQQQQLQQHQYQYQQKQSQSQQSSCFSSDQENYPANIQPPQPSSSLHITKSMVIRPPIEQQQQAALHMQQQQAQLQHIHQQQVQLQQQQSIQQQQQQQALQQQAQQQMPPPQQPVKSNEPQEPIVVYETIRSGDSKILKEYRQGEFLGKGGFAKCYLMTDVVNNHVYAAKIIPKSTLQKTRARSKLKSEIKIHSSLSHENIVKFEHCFENEENVYILLELCNQKTVMDIHKKRKFLMEYETKYYVYQVIMAVQHLHNNNIIHRDLKLGNLFIDNMRIKLGDFGLSTKVEQGERKKTICGTPNYIAPEILDNSNGHSYEVDVWSIGIILYTLLIGKPPFETSDVKHTYQRIKQNQYSFPDEPTISHSAKSLIISILNPIPEQRPNLKQILEHDFFTLSTIPKYLPVSSLTTPPTANNNNNNPSNGRPLMEKTNIVNQQQIGVNPQSPNKIHYSNNNNQFQQPSPKKQINKIYNNNNNNNLSPNSQQQQLQQQGTTESDDFHYRKLRRLEKMKENDLKTQLLIKQQYSLMNDQQQQLQQQQQQPKIVNGISITSSVRELETKIANNHISDSPPQSLKNNEECINGLPNNLVYISQHADFTNKYGLAYLLSNNFVGAYFNDSTKIITLFESEIAHYMEHAKGTDGDGRRVLNVNQTHPHDTQKKVTLIKYFLGHFIPSEILNNNGNNGSGSTSTTNSGKNNNENNNNVENNNNNVENSNNNDNNNCPIYVKKWVKFESGIAFRLSDKTIQVNYTDKSKIIIIHGKESTISFIPYRGQIRTASLNYFKNSDKKLTDKIKFIYETLITNLYNKKPDHQQQQSQQPQQSN